MTIRLNGRETDVGELDFLTYEDIVRLVGGPENVVHSIMWSARSTHATHAGTVCPGDRVVVVAGMNITAMITGNA